MIETQLSLSKKSKGFATWASLPTAFALFLIVCLTTGSKAEAMEFSMLGVASASNYNISPTPTVLSGGTGFGLGVTTAFDVIPFFALETGVLYLGHTVSTTISSVSTNITYNYFQIPLLFRFTPVSFFAVEAGGYYGIPASSSTSGTVPASLMGSGSSTYTTNNDYGLLLGVGLRFPLLPLMSLRLDALYEYGLANINNGTASQNSRNLDIWAGVMLSVM